MPAFSTRNHSRKSYFYISLDRVQLGKARKSLDCSAIERGLTMSTLVLAELVREQARISRDVLDRHGQQSDQETVEGIVQSALGLYDKACGIWNLFCTLLDGGLSSREALICGEMVEMFDSWVRLASRMKFLMGDMPENFVVPSLPRFLEACRKAQDALEDAHNGLVLAGMPPPDVSHTAINEAQALFASGQYKSTKEILARKANQTQV